MGPQKIGVRKGHFPGFWGVWGTSPKVVTKIRGAALSDFGQSGGNPPLRGGLPRFRGVNTPNLGVLGFLGPLIWGPQIGGSKTPKLVVLGPPNLGVSQPQFGAAHEPKASLVPVAVNCHRCLKNFGDNFTYALRYVHLACRRNIGQRRQLCTTVYTAARKLSKASFSKSTGAAYLSMLQSRLSATQSRCYSARSAR